MTADFPRPTKLARRLRNEATDAERHLWKHLRGSQIGGHKFSCQIPIGPFVCDFVCRKAMLIIEADGVQHDINRTADEARSRFIEARGYRVIRFWNNDVLERTEGVIHLIGEALAAHPTPRSPPHRGGEVS